MLSVTRPRRRGWLYSVCRFIAPSVVIAIAAGEARAGTIVITQRDTSATLQPGDPSSFNTATLGTTSVYAMTGNAGDSRSFGYLTPHGAGGLNASVDPGFSLSPIGFVSGLPNDTNPFTVTTGGVPASGNLTVNSLLGVNVAPAGAVETLDSGASGGYASLDVSINPMGNQSTGATFLYTMMIAGDYSASGTSTGDHTLLSVNPLWTITNNFTYNAGYTTFAAQISNYDPAVDGLNLHFQLYGSPVPLPSTAWLLLSGLAGLWRSVGRRINPPVSVAAAV